MLQDIVAFVIATFSNWHVLVFFIGIKSVARHDFWRFKHFVKVINQKECFMQQSSWFHHANI